MIKDIAILVEGSAEEAIIDVLIKFDKLIFSSSRLIDEGPIRIRNASEFERKKLNHRFDKQISVYRILDSKNEKFKIKKEFAFKIDKIISLYTTPEIEMLFITYFGDYGKFTQSQGGKRGIKPSTYCKENYKKYITNVKSYQSVYDFWSQRPDDLVNTIRDYARLSPNDDDDTLLAILK
ncbi:N-6 DNA methylase [Convivina intestini]|uniref:N-6 DNA methylase n=1 Tax=Convivina intestini TaxID=1505726 RepID=UPI00200BE7D9|nr:N-6 DNA methylase [Convivina intestini]CAH1856481.1 hypothetical protein R078131_01411 [Convivina intestini]